MSLALLALTATVTSTAFASTATPTLALEEAPDPLRYAKYAAIVDGGWSLVLTGAWALSARSYAPPHAEGIVAIATARVLYGTTWSVLLATEVAIARVLAGEAWSGMSQGSFKNHWLFGIRVPGDCRARGEAGGICGVGLGSFGEISALVTRGDVPIRVALTGGWIQGRYYHDSERTLMESTWVQSPVGVWFEPRLSFGPVALELSAGPAVFWGMHNAHLHPERGSGFDAPVHELIPLHYGFGPGVHGGLALVFFDAVALEIDADLAPLLLGGSNEGAAEKVLPMRPFEHTGVVVWRRAAAGIRFQLDVLHPLILAARVFTSELSPRPLDRIGHLAFGLQFEVPIELDDE